MKQLALVLILLSWWVVNVKAQGYGDPLTVQGVANTSSVSASSRAMGGLSLGLTNDLGIMFLNPAGLQSLKGLKFSLGAAHHSSESDQVQRYSPLKYYSNFSLLMEGLTGTIPDPDTLLPGVNAGDTVQRPFDDFGPNWNRKRSEVLPIQALAGMPFTIGDIEFAAGIGVVEYADMNYYYQNNNVLSPSILSARPIPLPRPPSDSLPVNANWSQNIISREGELRGYGAALSGSVTKAFSLGVSALWIQGSTDDFESQTERGSMTFFTNFFRLDSVYGRTRKTGTSEFNGIELTVSGTYQGQYVGLGFSAKPPMSITRTYSGQLSVDTTGSVSTVVVNEEDNIRLPWRGTVGIWLNPMKDLMMGLEYEIRAYASAAYTSSSGIESNPWVSSGIFHIGASFALEPWLVLRGGVRGQSRVFEPEGNPIDGEPVTSSVYSAGAGFLLEGLRLNMTYEFATTKYQDVWTSAVSLNKEETHTFIADISYEIPWGR